MPDNTKETNLDYTQGTRIDEEQTYFVEGAGIAYADNAEYDLVSSGLQSESDREHRLKDLERIQGERHTTMMGSLPDQAARCLDAGRAMILADHDTRCGTEDVPADPPFSRAPTADDQSSNYTMRPENRSTVVPSRTSKL